MDTYSTITNPQDKEKVQDMLITERYLVDTYNTFTSESSNKVLRHDLLIILNDVHELEFRLYDEMNKRGWHSLEYVNQEDIDKVKQSYSKLV